MPKFSKDRLREFHSTNERKESKKDIYFPPKEDQMTQQEVADMFGRTVQTIINWQKKRKIPYFRIGRRPIYSRKQLIEFASRNQNLINQ